MTALDPVSIRRRFLLLRALRWLPTGLMIPVLILLLTERGLTLGQIGLATSAQGAVILLLELPTGGLADAIGRRPVLIAASLIEVASCLVLALWADTVLVVAVVWGLQGIYRALESGPLDAWYVDAALAADPGADIEGDLGAGGAVIGVSIATGSMLAGGLVAWLPLPGVDALAVPLVVGAALRLVEIVAISRLMVEVRTPVGLRALASTAKQVPGVVAEAVGVVRKSGALIALVAVEVSWGFGATAWESLMPVHLGEIVGDSERAASLLGPVGAAAWLAFGAASAIVPRATRRFGAPTTAAAMRLAHALTVAAMAVAAGPAGVIVAYLATYGIHGASNTVHSAMLHREVDGPHRTTVLSVNSMVALPAGAIGGITLGMLADASSVSTAMIVASFVLATAAPLYLVAGRQRRDDGPRPKASQDEDSARAVKRADRSSSEVRGQVKQASTPSTR